MHLMHMYARGEGVRKDNAGADIDGTVVVVGRGVACSVVGTRCLVCSLRRQGPQNET